MRQEFGIRNTQETGEESSFARDGVGEQTGSSQVEVEASSIDVNLTSDDLNEGIVVKPWDKEAYREERAANVALIIALTFAAFLFIGAGLGGAIVLSRSPEEATKLIQAFTLFLESLGKSAALVFGPPLAFILGYYFRGKRR